MLIGSRFGSTAWSLKFSQLVERHPLRFLELKAFGCWESLKDLTELKSWM